jgi:hypothetical protein
MSRLTVDSLAQQPEEVAFALLQPLANALQRLLVTHAQTQRRREPAQEAKPGEQIATARNHDPHPYQLELSRSTGAAGGGSPLPGDERTLLSSCNEAKREIRPTHPHFPSAHAAPICGLDPEVVLG